MRSCLISYICVCHHLGSLKQQKLFLCHLTSSYLFLFRPLTSSKSPKNICVCQALPHLLLKAFPSFSDCSRQAGAEAPPLYLSSICHFQSIAQSLNTSQFALATVLMHSKCPLLPSETPHRLQETKKESLCVMLKGRLGKIK